MQSEIQLQAQCIQHTWNTHPETHYCIFHVPNGGKRNMVEATQLKASGVIAGVPDILMVWQGKVYAFEFKTEIGRLSKAQKKVHEAWRKQNIDIYLIRDFESWNKIILNILNK